MLFYISSSWYKKEENKGENDDNKNKIYMNNKNRSLWELSKEIIE